jgi:hypothetical protein
LGKLYQSHVLFRTHAFFIYICIIMSLQYYKIIERLSPLNKTTDTGKTETLRISCDKINENKFSININNNYFFKNKLFINYFCYEKN